MIIPITDITGLEKKTVANLFDNALDVSTTTKKHYFASFLSRNSAYDLLTSVVAGYPSNEIQVGSELESPDGFLAKSPAARSPSVLSQDSKRSKSLGSLNDIKPMLDSVLDSITNRSVGQSLNSPPTQDINYLSSLHEDGPAGFAEIVQSDARDSLAGTERAHIVHQKHPVTLPDPGSFTSKPNVRSSSHSPVKSETAKERKMKEVAAKPFVCGCLLDVHGKQKMAIDVVVGVSLKEAWTNLYGYRSAKEKFVHGFWKKLKYTGIFCS